CLFGGEFELFLQESSEQHYALRPLSLLIDGLQHLVQRVNVLEVEHLDTPLCRHHSPSQHTSKQTTSGTAPTACEEIHVQRFRKSPKGEDDLSRSSDAMTRAIHRPFDHPTPRVALGSPACCDAPRFSAPTRSSPTGTRSSVTTVDSVSPPMTAIASGRC